MIRLQRPNCPHPIALTNGNYKHEKNKNALLESTHYKCMYCESKITHSNYGDVEHIKPKAPEFFPELEFEWSNLGIVCDKCNTEKGKKYFADAEFIDPYSEDPSQHFIASGSILFNRDGDERGDLSIIEIDLNRIQLLERRTEHLKRLHSAYVAAKRATVPALQQAAINELKKEEEADKEYSFFAQSLFKQLGI